MFARTENAHDILAAIFYRNIAWCIIHLPDFALCSFELTLMREVSMQSYCINSRRHIGVKIESIINGLVCDWEIRIYMMVTKAYFEATLYRSAVET